ncbi:MAG: hypothetical protein IJZ39_00790 [Oscillospiraceae bacterium]|nr:hypothetical protein [Oscillospiraceae bacterium]
MKKMISLVLALVLMCGLAVTAYAANIDVGVSSDNVSAGDSLTVTITLEEDIDISEGATMMQGELHYDGSVLEFVSVEKGSYYASLSAFAARKHAREDKVLFTYLDFANYEPVGFEAGTIVTVTFQAKEDIAADHVNTVLEFKNAYVQNAQGKNVGDLTYKSSVSVLVCKEHTWDDGVVTTAPTCAAKGVKTYTCTFEGCGASYTEEIETADHTPVTDAAVPATCTETGLTEGAHCSVCGETIVAQSVVPATGHTEVKDPAVPATCTSTGLTEGSHCSVCGVTIVAQETTDKLAHDYVGEQTKAPNCTEAGEMTYTCSGCGDTYTESIDALGHAVTNFTVTKEPTCTEDGEKTGTCSVCGEKTAAEVIPATGHSFGEGVVTTAPTCTEEGVKTYTCASCGETGTEAVAANGHAWDEGTVTKEPTCTEVGEKTASCTVCGEFDAAVEIPATGHAWDEGTVTKEATCTEAGEKTFVCTVCGETRIEAVAATGAHTWDEGKVTTSAACAKKGVKTYTCSVCGETKTGEIPAVGHVDTNKDNACDNCNYNMDSVQTGDNSMVMAWVTMMVLASAAIVLLAVKKRRMA